MNTRSIITLITNNWPAKILALIMAILLYLYHQNIGTKPVRFDIPLTVIENKKLILTDSIPLKVRFIIGGAEEDINELSEKDFMAQIDISNYKFPGKYTARINVINLNDTSKDILNIKIVPEEITVNLDRRGIENYGKE